MHSINRHFIYLLTYLITCQLVSLVLRVKLQFNKRTTHELCVLISNLCEDYDDDDDDDDDDEDDNDDDDETTTTTMTMTMTTMMTMTRRRR